MTREDKELLLKDFCTRVPYDTVVDVNGRQVYLRSVDTFGNEVEVADYHNNVLSIEDVKPYLRPMSSMTEEEKKEFESIWDNGFGKALDAQISNFDDFVIRNLEITASSNAIDWLNAHHFDYRGLIPMGLAIKAPKGMYKL